MDTTILEDLGLTNAEIKVYISLLELTSSSAGKIIEKSGLQNSVTHRAINTLLQKGLISYITEGSKKIYIATDPENFLDFIEDKKEKFKQILPELKQKQELNKKDEKASIFKGKKGVTKVYNMLVNSNSNEYLTFGGGKECLDAMGDTWWANIHRKRIDNNLTARQVWDETVKTFLDHEFLQTKMTKIKFVDNSFAHFQETVISGKFVAMTIFGDEPYSILIEDEIVAEGYRKYFEILWKSGK